MQTSSGIVHFLFTFCAFWKLGTTTPSWHTAGDGNKYFIEGELKYNWLQANDECARRGLQLIKIDNAGKNAALIELLRNIFGKSHNLWLGYHDEFNAKKDTNRPFYAVATGVKLSFTNWHSGEPNNLHNVEHCAHIFDAYDFQWNDIECGAYSFGYICEDHAHTVKYHKDIQAIRQRAKQKNTQLSSEFSDTQSEIKSINENTRSACDKILIDLLNNTDEIVAELKKSIREIIAKKPYLEAVVADLGYSIDEAVAAKEGEFQKVSQEARQSVEQVHFSAESSTNEVTISFERKLKSNTNEIAQLLVF